MQTNENLVEQVNKIIQTNIDRREGYEKAIDEIKDPSLKLLFQECCKQSNENVNELRQIVIRHGGVPIDNTSTTGDMYRVWMDVKSALAVSNTRAVLQSCERGEDVALNAYRGVITASNGLSPDEPVMHALNKQEEGILAMHDKIKVLRDRQ